jgi:hypothetical protein
VSLPLHRPARRAGRAAPLGAGLLVILLAIAPAVAQSPAPAPTNSDDGFVFGADVWGARGLRRVTAAHPITPGALVLSVALDYFSLHGLSVSGDSDSQTGQRTNILYAPMEGLEVGAHIVSAVNKYGRAGAAPTTLQMQGNPSLLLKYSLAPLPDLGVGAAATLLVPTSQYGVGLQGSAYRASLAGLLTYVPSAGLEVTLNVGYTADHTGNLVSDWDAVALERLAYDVNARFRPAVSWLTYGIGGAYDVRLGESVGLAPYLEVTGQVAGQQPLRDAPLRVTFGVRGYPSRSRSVEIGMGGDVRLAGVPKESSPYANLPPWAAFGQITVHLGEGAEAAPVGVTRSGCQADADCAAGQSCADGTCVLVKEIVQEKEVVREVTREPDTFILSGGVLDVATDEPVPEATVVIRGFDAAVLSTDLKTGAYTSWPLPVGTGLVRITARAPGYVEGEQTVPRGAAGETKVVSFKLKSDDGPAIGTLEGNIKDGLTGEPVAGVRIFVPALRQKIVTAPDGTFRAALKAGRYQVLINAKRYVTQKKEVRVLNGDVVILNIDLRPKKKTGGAE